MSGLSVSEIDHLAKLARLSLSPAEKEQFSRELPKIAEFVATLQTAQIADAVPGSTPVDMSQLRADQPGNTGLTLEQLQALAPEFKDGQTLVPPVFGEQS